jgi:ribosomal protein S12 methylthiotransferase
VIPSHPSYWLDPLGCAKNQVDAETMMAVLGAAGWTAAKGPGEADLIIVNSCGFIESAKRESIAAVIGYRRDYPRSKILLAGCLARRYAGDLAESLTEADGFLASADPGAAAEAAAAALEGRRIVTSTAGAAFAGMAPGDRPLLSLPGSAYVKIAEGCDNHCSFCAIPLIRGPLRSRPPAAVYAECKRLLERGVRELCLVGQDLASWGRDLGYAGGSGLAALLEELASLEGSFWLRLLYLHPDSFPPSLLDLCQKDRRLLPYFDIPFQHASASLLRAMNRRGSAEAYLDLIGSIRSALPDSAIRSTFLTGFPGETEEDFHRLLDFQERAELDWAGVFTYSREEGTAAWSMKGRIAKKLALARKREIEERQLPITERRMERFVGRETEVLVEEKVEGEEGLYLGRLPCQAPEVDGSAVISADGTVAPGALLPGRIFARAGIDLEVRV